MQSLGTGMEGKSGILMQSIIPYVAVTLKAFIFCFAGEYLSSKVSIILLLLMDASVLYILCNIHR